jgi:hypothetical protein
MDKPVSLATSRILPGGLFTSIHLAAEKLDESISIWVTETGYMSNRRNFGARLSFYSLANVTGFKAELRPEIRGDIKLRRKSC